MKTAAVIIDKWKLPIFDKHLEDAGYTYTTGASITPNTLTLHVNYEWVAELQPIIQAANDECSSRNPHLTKGQK
jgi:hypothetical protein